MANIKKHLDNIKGALFGKDVRSSIHDGIDAINKEVESTTNRQEHLEDTFDQLVINSGNSNAEIVDARVGENGKSYAKLGDRLDEVDSQLEQNILKINDINYKIKNNNLRKGFVAHRGLISKAPENTLKAIEQACLNNFCMCELDIQLTADNEFVLMHDPTIDRTTNGSGKVSEMTLNQLKAFKIDTPTSQIDDEENIKIPTFEEALKLLSYYNIGVNIDGGKITWNKERAERIYGLLVKYNIASQSCISLPNAYARPIFKQYVPNLHIIVATTSADLSSAIEEYKDYNNIIFALQSSDLTDTSINTCNSLNIPIYVWNAHTTQEAYKWINKGVFYVETDYILPVGGLE